MRLPVSTPKCGIVINVTTSTYHVLDYSPEHHALFQRLVAALSVIHKLCIMWIKRAVGKTDPSMVACKSILADIKEWSRRNYGQLHMPQALLNDVLCVPPALADRVAQMAMAHRNSFEEARRRLKGIAPQPSPGKWKMDLVPLLHLVQDLPNGCLALSQWTFAMGNMDKEITCFPDSNHELFKPLLKLQNMGVTLPYLEQGYLHLLPDGQVLMQVVASHTRQPVAPSLAAFWGMPMDTNSPVTNHLPENEGSRKRRRHPLNEVQQDVLTL
jgi:hypothetical protein